jgi:hypothetical protein
MITFLSEANTSKSVADVIKNFDTILGKDKSSHLFQIKLRDNGKFSNPKVIEYYEDNRTCRTMIYYCVTSILN